MKVARALGLRKGERTTWGIPLVRARLCRARQIAERFEGGATGFFPSVSGSVPTLGRRRHCGVGPQCRWEREWASALAGLRPQLGQEKERAAAQLQERSGGRPVLVLRATTATGRWGEEQGQQARSWEGRKKRFCLFIFCIN